MDALNASSLGPATSPCEGTGMVMMGEDVAVVENKADDPPRVNKKGEVRWAAIGELEFVLRTILVRCANCDEKARL
jgi:hypothetical protein